MNKTSRFLSVLSCAALLASSAAHAAITVTYSGYGHNGNASQPAAGTSFNPGNTDTMTNPSTTHIGNLTTSDSLASAVRTLDLNSAGSGSTAFTASSNIKSASTVNDPGYVTNKQMDGGYYRYIGFSVDVTGTYQFTGFLKSRGITLSPGSNGQYGYYGLGGSASLEVNNFPNPNTMVYNAPGPGNTTDPLANTTIYSFNTTVNLTAGLSYQLNFSNYMYQGFGGTGSLEHNSGWDIALSEVPEPSTALCLFGGFAGMCLRRSRRS
jgi:hypothetical protein